VGAAPWTAWEPRLWPAPFAAAAVLVGCPRRFVVLLGRPPDEPERPQNRDLEDHEQEEDGPEPRHSVSVETYFVRQRKPAKEQPYDYPDCDLPASHRVREAPNLRHELLM